MQAGYFPLTPADSRRGSSEEAKNHPPKVLVSLGTVLIDCFQDPTGERQEIGGGGLYAIIGARIWLPARKLAIGIDRGAARDDFPLKFDTLLEHLNGPSRSEGEDSMWHFHRGEHRRTLKARIGYDGEVRRFEYLSPPPHRTLDEINGSPLAKPAYLHLVTSPSHTMQIIKQAEEMKWHDTKLVLEPHPKHCSPNDMEALKGMLRYLDVLSPNHNELLSLFNVPPADMSNAQRTRETIEGLIRELLDIGVGLQGRGTVVVRSGRLGACVGSRAIGIHWIPAFFGDAEQHCVVDVTGAGNSFLGGFVAGLAATNGDAITAALYGTVSASFIVQQAGLPNLSLPPPEREPVSLSLSRSPMPTPPASEDGDSQEERWNGDHPHERLRQLSERLASTASS